MSHTSVVVSAWLLAATFAWAALAKASAWARWREALSGYELPSVVSAASAVGVPVAEATVVALVVVGQAKAAAAATVGLTALFSLAIVRAKARLGDRIPCGCFGGHKTRDFRQLLARNTVLVLVAAVVLIGPRVSTRVAAPRPGEALPVVLVVLGIVAVVALGLGAVAAMRER